MTSCRAYKSYIDETGVYVLVPSSVNLSAYTTPVRQPCWNNNCLDGGEYNWYKVTISAQFPDMPHWGSAAITLSPVRPSDTLIAIPPNEFANYLNDWVIISAKGWNSSGVISSKFPVNIGGSVNYTFFIGKKNERGSYKIGYGHPSGDEIDILCEMRIDI